MIQTKADLREYIEADRLAQPPASSFIERRMDRIYKMKTLLRKGEYHFNNKDRSLWHKIMYMLTWYRCRKIQKQFCSEINPNVFDKGLVIWHAERIITNTQARVGKFCSISSGVVIAQSHDESPVIGDFVELMIDSKVLGGVRVADHVRIGANTMVIKNIDEPNTTWGGSPAKKINDKGTIERPMPTLRGKNVPGLGE